MYRLCCCGFFFVRYVKEINESYDVELVSGFIEITAYLEYFGPYVSAGY